MRSFCLGVWIVELEVSVFQCSIPAAIETTCFLSLSFDLREVCLTGEASKFVKDMEKLRCNARNYTLHGLSGLYVFLLLVSL